MLRRQAYLSIYIDSPDALYNVIIIITKQASVSRLYWEGPETLVIMTETFVALLRSFMHTSIMTSVSFQKLATFSSSYYLHHLSEILEESYSKPQRNHHCLRHLELKILGHLLNCLHSLVQISLQKSFLVL